MTRKKKPELQKTYFWKNREFSNIDPAVAAVALNEIKAKHGALKTAAIVEEARDPSHPLHDALPWDDDEAAQIGREAIAARLIRSLKVKIESPKAEPIIVRAFVSTSDAEAQGGRSYSEVVDAMSDSDARAFVLKQAWLQLKAWRNKYGALNELSDTLPLVDRILKKLAS